MTLSLLGGVLGVLLGAGGAVLAPRGLRDSGERPGLGGATLPRLRVAGPGSLFGIYPAVRASRLDPVEAMRTE